MQERQDHKRKGLTGLAKHGATVSMAPARAVSSHTRKIFHERYHGRFRFARLVFVFDLSLIGVAAILLAFNLTLFIQSYKSAAPGLVLEFSAPPLVAADETPFELDVKATDGKTHDGVELKWNLPAWVEVIQSMPRIGPDGTVKLGSIRPGEAKTSRLLVRIRTQAGAKVPIGFSVTQYDPLMLYLEYSGSETRLVERSALSVAPVFKNAAYISGASVPFVVSNDGRLTARAVSLRLASHAGALAAGFGSADSFILGDLAPSERRLVFVDLGQTSAASVKLDLELQDAAQTVVKDGLELPIAVSSEMDITDASITADGELEFSYAATAAASVMVSCNATSTKTEPYQLIGLSAATGTSELSSENGVPFRNCNLIPVDRTGGTEIVGLKKDTSIVGGTLPFATAVRYYSDTGDQLGVGPLPPRIGETTTYWVTWTVGPFDSDLENVRLETGLPAEVRATGKFASSVAGAFSTDGKIVAWFFPSLAMAGQEKNIFAFEIEFKPTEKDAGLAAKLLDKSMLTAQTTKDRTPIKTEAVGGDTNLLFDEKAKGRGAIE